jgi:hypothetical protein
VGFVVIILPLATTLIVGSGRLYHSRQSAGIMTTIRMVNY